MSSLWPELPLAACADPALLWRWIKIFIMTFSFNFFSSRTPRSWRASWPVLWTPDSWSTVTGQSDSHKVATTRKPIILTHTDKNNKNIKNSWWRETQLYITYSSGGVQLEFKIMNERVLLILLIASIDSMSAFKHIKFLALSLYCLLILIAC